MFLFLYCACFADTNVVLSPADYPYINNIDIINNYTESAYRLKTTNFIITGESIKDFTVNRVLTFTTFKISF